MVRVSAVDGVSAGVARPAAPGGRCPCTQRCIMAAFCGEVSLAFVAAVLVLVLTRSRQWPFAFLQTVRLYVWCVCSWVFRRHGNLDIGKSRDQRWFLVIIVSLDTVGSLASHGRPNVPIDGAIECACCTFGGSVAGACYNPMNSSLY